MGAHFLPRSQPLLSAWLGWGAGTGKTLLARAAAAECGASFLGINPSSVASKWFGDGVRFVRCGAQLPWNSLAPASSTPCTHFEGWLVDSSPTPQSNPTNACRAAFTLAEKLAPCVVFIDEVDALLGRQVRAGRFH